MTARKWIEPKNHIPGHGSRDNEEADQIILGCVERGLETMGSPLQAMRYIEEISGISRKDIPQNPEKFVLGLRYLFRYGSIVVLRSIVAELNAATVTTSPEKNNVDTRVKAFTDSINEGIKSIEAGII
jgi:hypothetical protein